MTSKARMARGHDAQAALCREMSANKRAAGLGYITSGAEIERDAFRLMDTIPPDTRTPAQRLMGDPAAVSAVHARQGMSPIAIFLCDKTGIAARPWAAAGIECWCVDIEHSIRRDRVEGLIHFVWGDVRSWRPPAGRRILFIGAFPPCTHVAVSGARDFGKKRGFMLRDALETFEASSQAIAWSGVPGFVENPVGILSSIPHIGKPGYWFHPCDYAGYLPDPSIDAYTKKTGIWPFNGFVMPPRKPVEPIDGSKMHLLPPSADRADQRSATPAGFSQANFEANCPAEYRRAAA